MTLYLGLWVLKFSWQPGVDAGRQVCKLGGECRNQGGSVSPGLGESSGL